MPDSIQRTVRLVMDPTGVRSGARVSQQALRGVERDATRAQLGVHGIANAFRSLTALVPMIGVGAGMYKTLGVIQSYDKQLASTSSVVKATAEEIELLDETARELGSKTSFTATQAQGALETLMRSGRTATEATMMAKDALDLAIAEQLEMNESAGFLTDTLKIMNLEVERSTDVADLYSKTASSANTTVRELGAAMVDAGAVSRQFNWDIEKTFGILAAWADQGTRGSEAGTAFRSVFPKLLKADTNKVARQALEEIGVDFEDIDPTKNDPEQILRTLGEAGLTLAQANKLVEVEMGVKLMQLVANYEKVGQKIKEVGDYHGETARKASIMAETISGKWAKVQSSIEAVILKFSGEKSIDKTIENALDWSADFIVSLGGVADAMGEVNEEAAELGKWFREHGQTILAGLAGFKFGGPWGAVAGVGALAAYRTYDYTGNILEEKERGRSIDDIISSASGDLTLDRSKLDKESLAAFGPRVIEAIEKEDERRAKIRLGAVAQPAGETVRILSNEEADAVRKSIIGGAFEIPRTEQKVAPPIFTMPYSKNPKDWGIDPSSVAGTVNPLKPSQPTETAALDLLPEMPEVAGTARMNLHDPAVAEEIAKRAKEKTEWEEKYKDLLEQNQGILDGHVDTLDGMKKTYETIQRAKEQMPEQAERLAAIEDEIEQKIRLQESALANVAEGTRMYREELSGVKTMAWEVAQMFQTVENQIVEAFLAGEFQAKKFFKTVLDMVTRMSVEKFVAEPIMNVIGSVVGSIAGGIGGGASSGGSVSYAGGMTKSFASGGYTDFGLTETYVAPSIFTTAASMASGGYTENSLTRTVASAYSFAGAPSFADGGRPDGIPIIAHSNEAVVQLNDGRAIPVDLRGESGGGMVFAPRYTTVVVPGVSDATSFNQSKGRLIRSLRNA